MSKTKFSGLIFAFLSLALVLAVSAQTKRTKRTATTKKPAVKTEQKPEIKAEVTPEPTPPNSAKKNSRPADENSAKKAQKPSLQDQPAFIYEFSHPEFTISHIRIEHDEAGKGTITFQKKDFDEEFTDPVQLSGATLEKLKTHFDALGFLDSSEDYQFEKDFSHIGNIKITMRKDEKIAQPHSIGRRTRTRKPSPTNTANSPINISGCLK